TAATAGSLKAIAAHSFINMPVTEQGGFVALLFLNHHAPREWPTEDLALIRDVADRTRTAVARREAEQALRASEARLRFLDTLARATSASADADSVMATTARRRFSTSGSERRSACLSSAMAASPRSWRSMIPSPAAGRRRNWRCFAT